MSRVIKFRAWHAKRGQWLHDGKPDGCHILGETILFGEWMRGVSIEELNDVVVEQFTGLNDKSGQSVYEGDIVEIKGEMIGHYFRAETNEVVGGQFPYTWKGVVEWDSGYAAFLIQYVGQDYDGRGHGMDLPRCKVLGNIHEHPHLLEVPAATP